MKVGDTVRWDPSDPEQWKPLEPHPHGVVTAVGETRVLVRWGEAELEVSEDQDDLYVVEEQSHFITERTVLLTEEAFYASWAIAALTQVPLSDVVSEMVNRGAKLTIERAKAINFALTGAVTEPEEAP